MCTTVCRVCLAYDEKIFFIGNHQLLDMYEKLTSAKLITAEMPLGVCYICCSLLLRCCRFSEMARKSEQILTDMQEEGLEVTRETIFRVKQGVIDNVINLSVAPMRFFSVNSCESIEISAVTVKDKPPVSFVKHESTFFEDEHSTDESAMNEVIVANSNEPQIFLQKKEKHDTLGRKDNVIDLPVVPMQFFPFDDSESIETSAVIIKDELLDTNIKQENTCYGDENSTEESTIKEDNIIEYSNALHISLQKSKRDNNLNQCNKCGKMFKNKKNLASHLSKNHSKVKINVCNNLLKNNNHKKQFGNRLQPEKKYTYCHCNKKFNYKSELITHMRTHTGDKPYKCELCGKSFNQKGHLNIHMRTHTGEKPYKCKQCDKSFAINSNFKHHLQTHNGEKSYKCKRCDKIFCQRSTLKHHMQTHTGEKPYKCTLCYKGFSISSNLKHHMRTHTEEKAYKCEQCEKSFYQNCDLKRHMQTHTGEKPFTCEQCHKSFSISSNLKSHMRTHTGEKPYKCKQCDKSFSVKFSFKRHMRTHTAEINTN